MVHRSRVGITQRQVHLPERGETRDTLDARLAELLWTVGYVPVPIPNEVEDPSALLDALDLDAIVLSGGDTVGQTPARDRVERAALSLAEQHGLPVLGICRGAQTMVVVAGGRLRAVDGHIRTRHLVEGLLTGRREVNSFHGSAIDRSALPEVFEVAAECADGTIEAVRHRRLPWTGILWHPEREDPYDPADVRLIRGVLSPGLES